MGLGLTPQAHTLHLRAWGLPAIRSQLPLGQLGRRLLHHRSPGRHAGSGVTSPAPRAAPAALTQRSRGVAAAAVGSKTSEHQLNKEEIVDYYDSFTAWQQLFGDHVHQGFYDPGATPSPADDRRAILRTVEETLRFADISDDPVKRPKKILDVGCGMGAGTIYLAKRFGAQCDGINISPIQIERGRALAAAEGLEDKVTFHLADAMEQPFPDGHFDLLWCMESAEQMPDKKKFMSELARVAAPGAKIVLTSVCHRDVDVEPLKPDEEMLLARIQDAYMFTSSYSASGYVKIAQSLSLQDIKRADWTENMVPFWQGIMQAAMTLEVSAMVLESGEIVI